MTVSQQGQYPKKKADAITPPDDPHHMRTGVSAAADREPFPEPEGGRRRSRVRPNRFPDADPTTSDSPRMAFGQDKG